MKRLTRILTAFRNALFPGKCSACGRFYHPPNHQAPPPERLPLDYKNLFESIMAPFLCKDCRPAFSPIESPKCPICGEMFKSRAGEDHTCAGCLTRTPHFHCVRSAGQYDGALMACIHAFKYGRKIQLARPLGRLLFHAYFRYSELLEPDIILPVPLHLSRLKRRGFNQAALVLTHWPAFFQQTGALPPKIIYDTSILRRIKKTPAQTGLGRHHRRSNIRQAFTVSPKSQIRGKTILLIDDVCTTAATVNECARILKRGGADCVNVLTLARAA